ncbi:uncharacterized protein LOC133313975 [Gastrolobium bilobum]|uniref:uncharacterized protein LOC133313975 n=1 Tax=Gastrolobium bilobum TaxID=150636 RepID=UPI002AB2D7EE|nr:uncharacterized protein LOC133313975 [Gastrolobium bilobum]
MQLLLGVENSFSLQKHYEKKKNDEEPIVEEEKKEKVKDIIEVEKEIKARDSEATISKFLDIFKKLQINIPFAEALENMSNYAKFMKDLLSMKRKLRECEAVTLTEKCSAIIQNKLPKMLKDLGSFSIPCTIGKVEVDNVLCDLDASINVMPLSMIKKLGITEVKPTRTVLQLDDLSTKQAFGIIKDILVKVDKFIITQKY